MSENLSPELVLDLMNPANCVYILNAKPNESIYPVVRCANSLSRDAKTATARRTADGLSFSVEVIAGQKVALHTWTWEVLTDNIHLLRSQWDRRFHARTYHGV